MRMTEIKRVIMSKAKFKKGDRGYAGLARAPGKIAAVINDDGGYLYVFKFDDPRRSLQIFMEADVVADAAAVEDSKVEFDTAVENLKKRRQAYEDLVLKYTGRDTDYHRRYETTGLDFAWEAFKAGGDAPVVPFQGRVREWMIECLGLKILSDGEQRNHRLLEESLELVQSCGYNADDAHAMVDYVFSRPVGEKASEAGAVMITLAALCLKHGIDMNQASETELARCWAIIDKVREKQKGKATALKKIRKARTWARWKSSFPISDDIIQDFYVTMLGKATHSGL